MTLETRKTMGRKAGGGGWLLGLTGAAVLTGLCARGVLADVRFAGALGDHMVVQRESSVRLWGLASPGERVRVSASWDAGATAQAVADKDGAWEVRLATPAAGGPWVVRAEGLGAGAKGTGEQGKEPPASWAELTDVLVGEVWVCGGQSNMEWTVAQSADAAKEIAGAKHPRIRFFDVANVLSAQALDDCERGAGWRVCSPETAGGFSAVGYFFARELEEQLDVPVGIVGLNWGGTVAEAWISPERAAKWAQFRPGLELVEAERREPGSLQREAEVKNASWWDGLDRPWEGWASPDHSTDGWSDVSVPGPWEGGPIGNFDGTVYYRREIDVPASWAGKDVRLSLGAIDDMDDTWWNGAKAGSTHGAGSHAKPRLYTIAGTNVRAGRAVIGVRVLDTGGAGGFSGAAAELFAECAATGERIALAGAGWKAYPGIALAKIGPMPAQARGLHPNLPGVLYNGMVRPVRKMTVRGSIWYQGESNRSDPRLYAEVFPGLIGHWREEFANPAMAFYFVQIAPFLYGDERGQTPELREAQEAGLSLANTGMVVTTDIGDPRDIHPANKQEVGRRLALQALAKTYGKSGVECEGPRYARMDVDPGEIVIEFSHASGLHAGAPGGVPGAPGGVGPLHFWIAGADKKFYIAQARIDGETVIVRHPKVTAPVAVRYAWSAAPETNVWNGAGLPMVPFRTDRWTIEECPAGASE